MQRFRKLGLFLLILAGAIVVTLFIMNRPGRAIRAAADLEYPELTDSENAALLYRAAWRELEATPGGVDRATLSRYHKSILARIGFAEELEEALSESDLGAVAQLLTEAEPVFEILRQVRSTKGCLFLQDHSPEAINENLTEFIETGTLMRSLARHVAARALWEAEQGNTDAALDWLTTGLHIANDLSDESVLIGELVRIAIGIHMLSAAQGILYNRPLPEPIPQTLLDELDDLRDRSHYGDSLRREGAFSEALMHAQSQGVWWFSLRPMWQGSYLEALDTFIEAVEENDHTERSRRIDELSSRVAMSSVGSMSYFHIYESMLLPALMRSEESLETLIAKTDLLELGLSLRAYEQTHGAFPDTLAELTPEYLAAIPEDPLNGKDYIYEKSDERVTVRSGEMIQRREIAFHLAPNARDTDSR